MKIVQSGPRPKTPSRTQRGPISHRVRAVLAERAATSIDLRFVGLYYDQLRALGWTPDRFPMRDDYDAVLSWWSSLETFERQAVLNLSTYAM